jgi:hypothetical protein
LLELSICRRRIQETFRNAQLEVELADARLDGLRLSGCSDQHANERGGDEV